MTLLGFGNRVDGERHLGQNKKDNLNRETHFDTRNVETNIVIKPNEILETHNEVEKVQPTHNWLSLLDTVTRELG